MLILRSVDVKKLKAKGGGKWKYLSVSWILQISSPNSDALQEKEMLDLSAPFAPYR